jgi:hypothetical protein
MRKYLLVILALTAVCYAGCKKEAQAGNGAPASADSYMPVTVGSSWTYFISTTSNNDTLTVKMNTTNVTTGGKTYYTANATSKQSGLAGIYFYEKDHVYATRNFNNYANAILELQLYNDTATINRSWVNFPSDYGTIGNIPVRAINTVEERGETKLFGGKTYTNVVHTEIDIQYDLGSGYETKYIYDYYLAKGIGILGYNLRAFGGEFVETEAISNYVVK